MQWVGHRNYKYDGLPTASTDDLLMIFKNLEKCDISKMFKTFIQSQISSVWCFFKSARPVCLHFKSIKTTHKTLFLPKSRFLHFIPKTAE